jgi:hypothetical protein
MPSNISAAAPHGRYDLVMTKAELHEQIESMTDGRRRR